MDPSDRHRLELFHNSGDQAAFASLVKQYLPLVYAVAMRVTSSPSHAQDLSQAVFVKLAQRPLATLRDLALPMWLHGETRSLALALLRSEKRRRGRETIAASLQAMMNSDIAIPWERISPLLDQIIAQLPARERELILARFFQGRSHRSIAGSLGLSEDASRMRVNRGLERMRDLLARRGIATTTAALAAALPGHAIGAAIPSGLAASVTTAACSAAAAVSFFPFAIMTLTKKASIAACAILIAGLAGVGVYHFQSGAFASGHSSTLNLTAESGPSANRPDNGASSTSKASERHTDDGPAGFDWDQINADNARSAREGHRQAFETRFAELVAKLDLTGDQQAALRSLAEKSLAAFDGRVPAADMELVEGKTLTEMEKMLKGEKADDADKAVAGLLEEDQLQRYQDLRTKEVKKETDAATLYQMSAVIAQAGDEITPENEAAIREIFAKENAQQVANGYSGGVRWAVFQAVEQLRLSQPQSVDSLDQAASAALVQQTAHRLIEERVEALKPYLNDEQLQAYRASVEQDFDLPRMDAVNNN
jgi:RNA polymerase sigma factor (sigma-70 family)